MSEDEPAGLTRHQAERVAVRWLRSHGHPGAAPAPGGATSGVDVLSPGLLARVVHSERPVRREEIRTLVDAAKEAPDAELAVFTSSRYELPALTYADARRVLLLAYDGQGRVSARNGVARSRFTPQELAAMPRPGAPAWVRYIPLVVAAYLAFNAVVLALAGAAAVGVVVSALSAVAIVAIWYRVTRRNARRTGRGGAGAREPGDDAPPRAS